MKSLKNFIKEGYVTESKTLINWNDSIPSVSREIELTADKITDAVSKHQDKLKKVFKSATSEQIDDYAAVVELLCIWLKNMAENAQSDYDDEDDENEYPHAAVSTCADPALWEDDVMDQVYNMDYDWQSIRGNKDKADLANEVINNWDSICKALLGKVWSE